MSEWMKRQIEDHAQAASDLLSELPIIEEVGQRLVDAFAGGGFLYTFGNGGSAADAQHFAGELIGRYKRERKPLPAVTLTTDPTVMTCIGNDYSYDEVFARQVSALARPGDVVAGFTTSGNSKNVVEGLAAAKARGATTVLFTGDGHADATQHADYTLAAPSSTTARIQEVHTLMLHLLSEIVDAWAAGETLEGAL